MNRIIASFFSGLILSLFTVSTVSAQSHKGISFQGVIQDPDGSYPTATGLSVTLQILDPVNDCVLREEVHSGVHVSNGYLNLVIGASSAAVPAGANPNPILTMQQLMDNSQASINGYNCTYVPAAGHARKLRLKVTLPRSSGGSDLVVADFNMRSVAFAVNSETLDGKTKNQFIQTSSNVTQADLEAWFSSAARTPLINGTYNAPTATSASIASALSTTLPVNRGGTNLTSVGTANQVLGVNAAAGGLEYKSITAGTNVTISHSANSIVINATGGGGVETDPTVQNFAKNTPSTGLSVNGSNQLTVSYGNTAGTSAAGNDPRLVNATQNNQANTWTVGGQVIHTGNDATVGLTIKANSAGQSALLLDVQNNSGTTVYGLNPSGTPSAATDLVRKAYVDSVVKTYAAGVGLSLTGSTFDITTVPLANGGTGANTQAGAANAILPIQTSQSGKFLTTNGSNVAWATPPEGIASLTGDVTATGSGAVASSVVGLRGNPITSGTLVAGDDGKVYRWNGSTFTGAFLNFGDLRTSLGARQFDVSCSASQTLTWSAVTDAFTCAPIAGLDAGVLTTGVINNDRLPASATYWSAATGGINYASGSVGIGTATPGAKLEVNGDLKVGGQVVVDTSGNIKVGSVVAEDSDCSTVGVGALARDANGNIFSCQNE